MLTDALRAVIVALSIVTCAIILSDIIEEEEILVKRGKEGGNIKAKIFSCLYFFVSFFNRF